jgi:hypothetical protein
MSICSRIRRPCVQPTDAGVMLPRRVPCKNRARCWALPLPLFITVIVCCGWVVAAGAQVPANSAEQDAENATREAEAKKTSKRTFTIKATNGPYGKIEPEGTVVVIEGEPQSEPRLSFPCRCCLRYKVLEELSPPQQMVSPLQLSILCQTRAASA